MKTLSSPVTFLFKYIFPFGYLFILVYSSWSLLSGRGTHPDKECLLFLLGCLFIVFYGFTLSFQLKRVRMDNQSLYISNYMREITVPAGNIKYATQRGWMIPNIILITFEKETQFGDKIRFVPPIFRDWEVMADLRQLMRNQNQ